MEPRAGSSVQRIASVTIRSSCAQWELRASMLSSLTRATSFVHALLLCGDH